MLLEVQVLFLQGGASRGCGGTSGAWLLLFPGPGASYVELFN